MKRIYTILATILLTAGIFAQFPEKMSYQAVVRDNSNKLLTNKQIGMQISVLQGSATGTVVYEETQTPTSNSNGLVSIEIGTGITTDDFSAIDWSDGPFFIRTGIDPEGGINYTISGTSQLLSVPYAFHAKTAENLERAVNTGQSLTGGGDLSADRTLTLVNDKESPGINKVYGTDSSGKRGWKDNPLGEGANLSWFPALKKDYGAVGDSTTDDSDPWNNFIAAAITAGGGIIEPGTYRIPNATMQQKLPANFTLIGIGRAEKTILDFEADRDNVSISKTGTLFFLMGDNIRIEGIQFRRFPVVMAASDGTSDIKYNSFAVSGDLAGLIVENCIFDRVAQILWIRAQEISANWRIDNITVRDCQIRDCALGFHIFVLNQHNFLFTGNRFRMTSWRPGGREHNAIAIDCSNADLERETLCQVTNHSGGHIITGNIFERFDYNTSTSAQMEVQHIRITLQNDCVIENNFFGPITAPNVSSSDFDVEQVYSKIAGASISSNVFEGPIAGGSSTSNAMLRLKGVGIYFLGTENNTKARLNVVTNNIFRGTGKKDLENGVRAAIDMYQDHTIISNNTFEDIYLRRTLLGIITINQVNSGNVFQNNSFYRILCLPDAIVAAIYIARGGKVCTIDGVYVTKPTPDNVGSQFIGVYLNDAYDAPAVENLHISRVHFNDASASLINRLVRINLNGHSKDVRSVWCSQCSSDGVNIDAVFRIDGAGTINESGIVVFDNNDMGAALVENPNNVTITTRSF